MMETLIHRLTFLGSSDIALLMVALQYAVLAPAWVVAALAMPGDWRAAGWWAVYAAGSALGLLLILVGMHQGDAALRAAGHVLVLMATLALQRGVWSFTGQPRWNLTQGALALVTLVMAVLAVSGIDPASIPAGIAGRSAMPAGLYLWIAADVWRHVHRRRRQHWGLLYASPLLLAALLLGARSVRALQAPQTVMMDVQSHTVLSVGSSLIALVAALVLQMMLVSLLLSRLVVRLDRLSRHDPLTGLLNRRAMDALLVLEEQRVRRLSEPGVGRAADSTVRLAVLMIDIDHFKQLNDKHGHAVGDRALQQLAAVMAAQLRDIDHLARWGGEEFLALLPATGTAQAVALAERLCERARSLPLMTDDGRVALTISIGVADWLGAHDSHADLLHRADAALYCAKREGRDQMRRGGLTALEAVHSA